MNSNQNQAGNLWQKNINWKDYNSWRLDGEMGKIAVVNSKENLIKAVLEANNNKREWRVVGGGTNILIPDNERSQKMIFIINRTAQIERGEADKNNLIMVESGAKMSALGSMAMQWGLSGLEEFTTLPGSLGGAIYNNSHFGEKKIAEVIEEIIVFDGEKKKILKLTPEEAEMGYDESVFHGQHHWLIIGAILKLKPENNQEKIQKKMAEVAKWRAEHQPLGMATAGCVFQNVKNNDDLRKKLKANGDLSMSEKDLVSAGFLIDKTGLKGLKIGNFMISKKHANFIENLAGNEPGKRANRKELISLIDKIKTEVKKKWGVELIEEVIKL